MPGKKKPNVLLITSDQQHWHTLGHVNPEVRTPHLDRLAAAGTVFSRAYCPNPTCTPTRASIITGLYPSAHGAWSLGTKLPENVPTVGERFTAAGYRTALVGKAHFQPLAATPEYASLESYPLMQDLDFWRGFSGPFYGFEHVQLARNHADEAHVGQHYALWMEEQGCADWRAYFRPPTGRAAGQRHHWPLPEEYHYNAWIAARTGSLLEEYAGGGENFFLWASFFDPHPPYLAPAPWDTMYDPARVTVPAAVPGEHRANPPHHRLTQEREPDFSPWLEPGGNQVHGFHSHLFDREQQARNIAVYYGMISLMDKYVGRILQRLQALNLERETIVVFTTDHGHFFGQHGLTAKGAFLYEDMVRVPFIVRWPGRVPAGRRSPALQSLVDLAPTFLSLAGLPAHAPMSGLDQGAVWTGETDRCRGHVMVENRHQPTTVHQKCFIDQRYKLTVYYQRDYGELFDLERDPGETENLWDRPECAALRERLLRRFISAELGNEPLSMPRITTA